MEQEKRKSNKTKSEKFKIKHPEGRSAFAKAKRDKRTAKRKADIAKNKPKREAREADKATKRNKKWVEKGKPIARVFKSKSRKPKKCEEK